MCEFIKEIELPEERRGQDGICTLNEEKRICGKRENNDN